MSIPYRVLEFYPFRKIAVLLHTLLSRPIVIEVHGLKIAFPPHMLEPTLRNIEHIVLDHEYMEYLIEDCHVLTDIGAGIGLFTAYLSKVTNLRKAFLIEANRSLVPYIDLNMKLNAVPQYTIINRAVCIEPGAREITLYVCNDGYASSTKLIHVLNHCSGYTTQRARCLDSKALCRILELSDTVKIDIEGVELTFLTHYRSCLSKVRNLIIEVHTDLIDHQRVAQILEDMGFKLVIHISTESPQQITILARSRRT